MKQDKKIKLDMTDEEFLRIAKEAHEHNITFNHMVERIVTKQLIKLAKDIALDAIDESLAKSKEKQHPHRRSWDKKPSCSCGPRKKVKR
jgi:hypothetical protein